VTPPISEANLRAFKACSDTPAELEKLLTVYALGYLQATADALTAQANATQQEK